LLQVRKRKRSPYYQIVGHVKTPNGSIRIRQSTKTTDRQEAEKFAHEIYGKIIDQSYGRGHSTNYCFRDATIDYLNAKESIDPSTEARIRFLNQHFGNTRLSDINNGMFNTILNRTKPGIKPSYFNRIRGTLTAILKYGSKQRSPNITIQKIEGRQVEKPKPVYLSYEEQERLINAFNPILQPLIIFLCYSGARIGEAVCLLWKDVDMDKRTVTFWDTKNGDFRSIPMHERVYESLRLLNREREGPVFLSTSLKPFRYFYTRLGNPLDKTHTRAVKSALGSHRKFKVHNWRSHWASTHALAGINDKKLMSLGGWNDSKSVSHYIRLNPEHLRDDINKMK
jgi:integrase